MSFPRYPEYKDSGVPWLGEVPAHWQVIPLIRTASGSNELFIDGDWIESSDLADEGIRYITTGNVGEGKYKEQGMGYISEATFQKLRCTEVLPGDVLVSRLNMPIGRACIVPDLGGKVVTSVDNVIVRTSDHFDRRFLIFLLSCKSHFANMENLARGTTMQRISRSALGRVRFAFPPVVEQMQIAALVDSETSKIDALVAEQEKLMGLLKEKRQAVISHAVTKGLDPTVQMKDSGVEWLGDVPAHWSVKRLKFVAVVQTGIAKGKNTTGKEIISVPYLRVANVQDGYLALESIAIIDIEPEQLSRYQLMFGDVLMNEGGDFDKLGRGAIWKDEIQNCIHQNHVFAVRPHAISPQWLNQVTGSEYAQFYFKGRSKQSTNLASISSSNVMEFPVVLPPDDEQIELLQYIEERSQELDTLKAEAEHSIAVLVERRTALISAAVTGKIDVRGLTKAKAA